MKQLFSSLITIYLNFLKVGFLLLLLLMNDKVKAQDEFGVIQQGEKNWLHFTDTQNSLYHHLSAEAYDLLDKRDSIVAGVCSLADWRERQGSLRETLMDIVGPFPEKTSLNAKVLRIINKDDYRVEHIVFESQPGFYVPSTIFIPGDLKDKAPVVIYTVGHSDNEYYQTGGQPLILNLVKKGFIVFAFDPVGQGERLGYYDSETGKSSVGGPTTEHSYPGAQAFVTGSSLARYMIWDGIRAVDYLMSREEVDPNRIGITGKSGGGTQSAYIAAFDERIYAAAPSNFITTLTRLLQSIGPQDSEQNLPGGIAQGIDLADLLIVRAPKPALMVTTTNDFFSIQGARETAKEVSDIYEAYGKEDNFGMVEDDAAHVLTTKNREALYAFFQEHLDNPGNPKNQEVKLLTAEEIQVTETGQVSTSFEGETIFSLNRDDAEKLVNKLKASRADLDSHLPEVLESAKELSGYREPSVTPEPAFTGRIQRDGYVVKKYFIEGEGDYIIPYLLMVPDKPNNKSLIYLHPSGKAVEASAGGEMEWFVRRGFTVLAPDLVGIGEMGTGGLDDLRREWRTSILIDRSIVGIHAGDVVKLARLLKKDRGVDEIYGLAREEMAPVLLHAAAFEPAISRIALIEPYLSYRSIVMNRFYNPDLIPSTVPGALEAYDLPDLAASLAPRKLLIAGVKEGVDNNTTTDSVNIDDDLSVIKAAYQKRDAGGQLEIIEEPSEKPANLYKEWIK